MDSAYQGMCYENLGKHKVTFSKAFGYHTEGHTGKMQMFAALRERNFVFIIHLIV